MRNESETKRVRTRRDSNKVLSRRELSEELGAGAGGGGAASRGWRVWYGGRSKRGGAACFAVGRL